ncbi:hypothetical protein PXD04_03870 [Methanosphaera sp. ISO3-F5]|uniref:hypothetical protein n=1 Tax=Methanosphaera sp. ISO3-F5 TaxID=1452353 RepID=UPI002B25A936|nr:hypothetical protein [Methanosphaera sp. ISO3-F5]WQH65333.1 hypothetical protein PXD04_03870 [Methanosphaera sp. ISO3-F5]
MIKLTAATTINKMSNRIALKPKNLVNFLLFILIISINNFKKSVLIFKKNDLME